MSLRRRTPRLAAVAAALALAAGPGCIGPFKGLRAVHEFNQDPTSPWVEELVFVGFLILPVYEITFLIDVLVLNAIDFWERQ